MFRVPDNRPHERTTKGEQPFEDDRETLARNQEEIETEAEELGAPARMREAGGSERRLEKEAEARFAKIAEQASRQRD